MTEMSDLEQTLSRKRRVFAVFLCLTVYMAEGMNNSLPSPFFPTEAKARGVSQTMVGIIIASFNIFATIASIFMLLVASPTKMKTWFCIGAITSGATCLIFGELIHGPPGTVFSILCIITRAFMGCGASAIWGSGAPIILPLFPKWQGRIMSLIEFMVSLGVMAGPPIASLLFRLGGYTLPFRVAGALEVVLALVCFLVFPSQPATTTTGESSDTMSVSISQDDQSAAMKFIINPGVIISSLPLLMNTAFMGFTTAAFSPYLLVDFGIKQDTAGIYFIPYSLVNTIGTILMGGLVDKGYGGVLYCLGAMGSTIAFLALALPSYMKFLVNIYYVEAAFIFGGLSFAAVLTPGFLLYVKVGQRNRISSTNQLKVFAASWMNFTFTLGQTYGQAFVGGIFFEEFWFYNSCLLQAVASCVVTMGFMVYMVKRDLIWTVNVDEKQSESTPLMYTSDEDAES